MTSLQNRNDQTGAGADFFALEQPQMGESSKVRTGRFGADGTLWLGPNLPRRHASLWEVNVGEYGAVLGAPSSYRYRTASHSTVTKCATDGGVSYLLDEHFRQLGAHIGVCNTACGRLFPAYALSERIHSFLAPRFFTTITALYIAVFSLSGALVK